MLILCPHQNVDYFETRRHAVTGVALHRDAPRPV